MLTSIAGVAHALQSPLRWLAAALVLLAAGGCGTGSAAPSPDDSTVSGLQLTGTIDGHQVAVSDGSPRLLIGNCAPREGPSRDVCIVSKDIGGELVVLALKNPDVLHSGATLAVGSPGCAKPARCDRVRNVAIVDLQRGVGGRQRAVGGRLAMTHVMARLRYAGSFTLLLPNGRVSGAFDVGTGAQP
ncbi:hypothetical protein BH20ACT9_BH20ACT9_12660 [soil metagenome]